MRYNKPFRYPLCGLKLIKLDDIKNLRFKKGNRDRVVSELLDSSLVEKGHEQVKTKRYAATDGNFLSHAHYGDPYFDFMRLLSKLTSY